MNATRFYLQWSADRFPRGFRTGVSQHSHTLHSEESLDFIYKAARYSPILRALLRYGDARHRKFHGKPLDMRRGWWTPPLAPLDAHRVEAAQVESLGLTPIVSLTDHDSIEAPMSLQAVDPASSIPVSVEWTVPYGRTFFHIGVHNLPSSRARGLMAELAAFTAEPDDHAVREILEGLDALPGSLLVFNHPLWDEKGIGTELHREHALRFLQSCGEFIHAIEINGLRPWDENRRNILLAKDQRKPVVSGGDRHALEPNAVLNLTNAESFAEFAQEVRDGVSNVFVTNHYRQSHFRRIVHNFLDVLQPYDEHGLGWREWPERVFYRCADDVVRSLREIWLDEFPAPIRALDSALRFAGHSPVRNAMRSFPSMLQQVVL